MAVIKCSNCENDILDSEIVCPYCDNPVNVFKTKAEKKSGTETKAIPVMKAASKDDFDDAADDTTAKKAGKAVAVADDDDDEVLVTKLPGSKGMPDTDDDDDEGFKTVVDFKKPESADAAADEVDPAAALGEAEATETVLEVDKNVAHLEAIQKSFEERRKARMNNPSGGRSKSSRRQKKKKSARSIASKIIVLVLTIVGIWLIIKLGGGLWDSIFGSDHPKQFDEKENKKAKVSAGENVGIEGKGFVFGRSDTSTLVIESDDAFADITSEDSERPWDEFADDIEHITISEGVTEISPYAFAGLKSLKDVTIGKKVKEIGDFAFAECDSLTRVKFNPTEDSSVLTRIGDNAFDGCESLKDLSLGKKIAEIGEYAFRDCTSMQTITIKSETAEISDDAFYGIDDIIVICEEGSDVEAYCKRNNIESMTEEEYEESGGKKSKSDKDDDDDEDIDDAELYVPDAPASGIGSSSKSETKSSTKSETKSETNPATKSESKSETNSGNSGNASSTGNSTPSVSTSGETSGNGTSAGSGESSASGQTPATPSEPATATPPASSGNGSSGTGSSINLDQIAESWEE